MGLKINLIQLSITLYILHTEAFILRNNPTQLTKQKRATNKLAQALNAIDTQRQKRGQNSHFNSHDTPSYSPRYGSPGYLSPYQPYQLNRLWSDMRADQSDVELDKNGYDWSIPENTNDEDYYSNEFDNYVDNYYDYSYGDDNQDLYQYDDDSASEVELSQASDEELSDIMSDNEEYGEQDGVEKQPGSVSPTNEELKDIFSDESEATRDKKTPDWAPHVLGMSGLKRSGASANSASGAMRGVEAKDGHVRQLSDAEIKQLLSSAKSAEVQNVDKEIEVTNINGKQQATAKEIEDILTDEDGDGETEEIIIEHDIPVEQARAEVSGNMEQMSDNIEQLNNEVDVAGEQIREGLDEAAEQLNDNMEVLTREVLNQYPDRDADFSVKRKRSEYNNVEDEIDTSNLAAQCLVRYIMLEDAENTDLSEALDWATRAQYEGNDNYIPMQVDYLRKAVLREQSLRELQEQCLALLGVNILSSDIEEEPDYVPDSVPLLDEGRPRKRGEYVPNLFDDYSDDSEPEVSDNEAIEELLEAGASNTDEPMIEEDGRALIGALDDAYEHYLEDQVKQYLIQEKLQLENQSPYLADGVMSENTWLGQPIEDEDLGENKQWMLNPFVREIIEKYQRSDLEDPYDEDYGDSVDLPEYPPSLEDMYETKFFDEDICSAVEDVTDNCAYALALGWRLDDEAMALCNRHQLCYACGESHGITADMCDIGYQAEAYRACASETNEMSCIEEADSLYNLMTKVHTPVYSPRLECAAPCVEDYISGEYFKK